MANEEHLSVLLQGSQEWNGWRDANPEVQPDLRKADLHEAELSGAKLSRAVLIDADLQRACLKEADLAGANLRRADLRNTDLQRANLHGATLAKTDLREANLSGADLREADLREARLPGAILEGADLKGAVLSKEGIQYASTHDARLKVPLRVRTAASASQRAPLTEAVSDRPEPKSQSLKMALAVGVALLVSGFLGFWALSPSNEAGSGLPETVSAAAAKESGVDFFVIEGETLVIRSSRAKVESGMYLSLLKNACQTLGKMEPANALRAIRITNRGGDEGWVYSAPQQCGEILAKPAALTSLSVAAHTTPFQK